MSSTGNRATARDENVGVQPPKELKFLEGGGAMGELMRGVNWSKTILGSPAAWPQSLKTSVSTCLNSRFAILIWWGNDLIKLYNDAYLAILGKKHPHALGSPGREVWPEIWHIIGPMLQGVLERGEATWADDLLLELERDGYAEQCYFTFSYSPIRDESGKVVGVFTPVQETTGKVIGQRRLRTLRDLADAARASNAQNTVDVCKAAAHVLGQNPQDIPFAAIYTFEHDRAVLNSSSGIDEPSSLFPNSIGSEANASSWFFARALESVVPEVLTFPEGLEGLTHGVWPLRPSEAICLPIRPAGQRIGFMIAAVSPRKRLDADYRSFLSLIERQISTAIAEVNTLQQERRRAEALAEIDRAKTTFFSNVSHEFRTPLTLMLGPLEDTLALRSRLPDEAHRSLLVIHRNGVRLLRLVNSLLDFSRIEAGRMRASYEPTDLSSFTAELASNFRSATDNAGLALIVECASLPGPVYVDREMWEKIVLNLVSNAFKFTFNGQITVELEAVGDHVELRVKDTGIGIAEHQIPHLFERFHRVEGAKGRTIEGTGIGLALIQELVRIHEGSVHVASEEGRGSTFTVSIPFHPTHLSREDTGKILSPGSTSGRAVAFVEEALQWLPEHGEVFASAKPQVDSQGENAADFTRNRDTVLVVDDNTDMRQYLGRLLSEKFHVIAAANGEEALNAARTGRVDLVLSDIMMPGLDGYGLIRSLRSDPKTQTIPVILLSARAGEEDRSEGMGTGADDYLVKPFAARELLARVEAHLSLARMRRDADQARRLSELRLKLALEATGVLAWQWVLAKDELSSSGDMVRIFGTKLENSAVAFRLVHPEDLAAHRAKVERVAREGGSYHSEFRIRRADSGATAWLEERATGIDDDSGRVVCVVGVVADVTERKQAEALLRQQWHTFDTALSHTPTYCATLTSKAGSPTPTGRFLNYGKDRSTR
jgi:PAS domain S-box-containing protein